MSIRIKVYLYTYECRKGDNYAQIKISNSLSNTMSDKPFDVNG